jgi:hypothetical protein
MTNRAKNMGFGCVPLLVADLIRWRRNGFGRGQEAPRKREGDSAYGRLASLADPQRQELRLYSPKSPATITYAAMRTKTTPGIKGGR